MNPTIDALSLSTFGALFQLSEKTERAYTAASFELAEVGPKALLGFLAGQHQEHIDTLRRHCERYDIDPGAHEIDDSACEPAWREIREALGSRKRDVVLITCQLLERLSLRACRHALRAFSSHAPTLEFLGRRIHELEATQDFIAAICSQCTPCFGDEQHELVSDRARRFPLKTETELDDAKKRHRLPPLKTRVQPGKANC